MVIENEYWDGEYLTTGDKVYTEDKILVYNLKLRGFPENVTVEEVTKYLSTFGEVLNVRVDENKYQEDSPYVNKSKDYVVQFSKPEDAAKVCLSTQLYFGNNFLSVVPCYGWDQPDGKKFIEQLNKIMDANSVTSQAYFCNISNEEKKGHILDLNDDCLEHIYKYLNTSDQINFALAAPRFLDAFVLFSKFHYKIFNAETDLTIFKIRMLFQMVGHQIKTFTADYDNIIRNTEEINYFLEFSRLFLINIENLKVIHFDSRDFGKLIENMTKLKILIINKSHITGREIMNLYGLEKLILIKCRSFSITSLTICECLTNLTYLSIQHIPKCNFSSTTEDYEHLAKHLLQLKTLKIGIEDRVYFEVDQFCWLIQLPKLKILFINLYYCELSGARKFFKDLVKYKANQLEELGFVLFESDLDVATSVAKLQKLKVLKCYDVSDECLEVFSQLHELEDIVFLKSPTFSNKALIKFLEQRSNLKRIIFDYFSFKRHDLLSEVLDFVKRQRAQGHRKNNFKFLYQIENFSMSIERNTKTITEYVEILNI